MTKPFRFGSAISVVAVASMIAGCAAPQRHASSASSLGGKADGEVGLATRALAALAANDPTTAIDYAERALTAQARRSLRWRSGSSRSVNAALLLLPGAERGRGARRGTLGTIATGAGSI